MTEPRNLYDVEIDGFSLNGPFHGVDRFDGRRAVPSRKLIQSDGPGQNGVTPRLGSFDSHTFTLRIWLIGAREGKTPTTALLEQTLDSLLSRFVTNSWTDITWFTTGGKPRYARCRVVGSILPDIDTHTKVAYLTVVLENPRCFWRAPDVQHRRYVEIGKWADCAITIESTAPIFDSVITIQGPANGPKVYTKGAWVKFNGTIPSGQTLVIDNEKRRASLNGVSVTDKLAYGGSNPRFLDLYPRDQVRMDAASTTANTWWRIDARPAYT